jgi:hypothetical protein
LASIAASPLAAGDKPAKSRAALEKEFAAKLTGAVMVGTYSIDGRPETGPPKTDRYEIEKAEKLEGDRWMITARIKYGEKDVNLPIPIDVLWAGDTPVLSLTKATIPGLGTFTTRVMVYGDRYAGTWQHDAVGGQMWGRIEKAKPGGKAAAGSARNP